MDKKSIRKTDRKTDRYIVKEVSKCADPDRQRDGERKREGEKIRREGIGEIGSTRGEG